MWTDGSRPGEGQLEQTEAPSVQDLFGQNKKEALTSDFRGLNKKFNNISICHD